MLIIIAIICVVILLAISRMLKTKPDIEEENYQPVYDDEDLAYLRLFYKHNEIQPGQRVETYETFSCFRVEGYNKDDYRKVLYPEKMSWSSG